MMKLKDKLMLVLLISCCSINVLVAQELVLHLFFKDSQSNKNTIMYVNHDSATTDIDGAFGKLDISVVPLKRKRLQFYTDVDADKKNLFQKKGFFKNGFQFVTMH